DLGENLKDIVEIVFQTGQGNGCGIFIGSSLDFRSADLEIIVELIASLVLSASSAPDFAVQCHESRLRGRFRACTTTDPGRSVDSRQLMIFLEEDDHSIRKHNSLGFLRMKRGQRRYGNLCPWLLCDEPRDHSENQREQSELSEDGVHCAPPMPA